MKDIPVVFLENTAIGVHGEGVPDWFLLANTQARSYGNAVYWLGNTRGADAQLQDLMTPAYANLLLDYVHMSTNHYTFELFCLTRWFYLLEFMKQQDIELALHCDSDVLLYCNAGAAYEPFKDCWFTLALGSSPATSYIQRDALRMFCEFVSNAYANPDSAALRAARGVFEEMQAQHLAGGISDMYWWREFAHQAREVNFDVGEMTTIHGGTTFDHNINTPDGYLMRGGIKDVRVVSDKPEGYLQAPPPAVTVTTVRFNALHFQGGAKHLMKDYARAVRP